MKMIKERWDKSASLAAWAVGRMDGVADWLQETALRSLRSCAALRPPRIVHKVGGIILGQRNAPRKPVLGAA